MSGRNKEIPDAVSVDDLRQRGRNAGGRQGAGRADERGLCGLYRGDAEGGRHSRWRAAAPDLGGNHRAGQWRQDTGARRTLCGHQGAARRLLPDRRAGPRCRIVLGGQMSRCFDRHDGSAADLADAIMSTEAAARATAEDVARRSYGKLVAYLAARTRDVAAAEDALSDAFAAALADWSANGIPQNPEAWLV